MIILLEGPDRAGKTTLAQRLVTEFAQSGRHVRLLRRGPIINDVFTEYLRPLDDLIGLPNDVIYVLDRWHVGELIYGPLLRDRSELTVHQANYIEMVLQTFGCHFTLITQSPLILEDRWDRQPDSLVKREWLGVIARDYDSYVMSRPHWNTVLTDHNTLTFDVRLSSPLPGRYVGPPRPAVLLLGDRRNVDTYTWPFVPARATSGHWLMGSLAAANVDHMTVGMVNASELRPEELDTLWYTLGSPPVVALGKNAERAWRTTGLTASLTLNHPQFQRRFHYRSFEDYGQMIKEAMKK